MASEIDIANLALAHLGDSASVSSLNPPEGSAQAEHCAMFYPIARDSLLELHTWGFSTRRVVLAQVANSWTQWQYAYAIPSDAINLLAVLASGTTSDLLANPSPIPNSPLADLAYSPQPFIVEADAQGNDVLYTNQPNAILRYTAQVTDTSRFSPLFVMALSWHLASLLAGAIIKGDTGAAEAKRCSQMMQSYLSRATESDANQRRAVPAHVVDWMGAR